DGDGGREVLAVAGIAAAGRSDGGLAAAGGVALDGGGVLLPAAAIARRDVGRSAELDQHAAVRLVGHAVARRHREVLLALGGDLDLLGRDAVADHVVGDRVGAAVRQRDVVVVGAGGVGVADHLDLRV